MKSISKKRGEVGKLDLSKALNLSPFEDEDVKKAIRASVSAAEVIEIGLPAKDMVNQALSAPYVAQQRQVNMAAALLHSLKEKEWGLSTAGSHHVTRTEWLSARNQLELEFS
eukprot:9025164-Ditylum_brightwellii.AAC.1